MKLSTFCKEVNRLACEQLDNSFGLSCAVHIDYDEAFLKHYHKMGYSPQEALDNILWDCEQEGRAEALAS